MNKTTPRLEWSDEWLKASIECANVSIFWYDQEARILFANHSFQELVGYSIDELRQMTIGEIDHLLSTEEVCELLKEPVESGRIESIHRHKSGKLIPVEILSKRHQRNGVLVFCAICVDVSERKSVERELEKMRQVVEHAVDAVIWYDREGNQIYANSTACEWFGYSKAELESMHCFDLSPSMTVEKSEALFKECLGSGSVKYKGLKACRDGTTIPVEIVGNHFVVGGESIFCTFIRDISEQNATEQMLRFTQLGFDATQDAMIRLDEAGKITYTNQIARKKLGYSAEEMKRLSVFDLHEKLSEDDWRERWNFIKVNGFDRFETSHVCKDGSQYDCEFDASFLSLNGEDLVFCVVRDISTLTHARHMLGLSLFSLDHCADSVVWYLKDGTIVNINETFNRNHGYQKEELVGKSIMSISRELSESRLSKALARIQPGTTVTTEEKHTRKNGTVFPVEIRTSSFLMAGETYYCSFVRDITLQKKQEEQSARQLSLTQQTVEHSNDAVFWLRTDGSIYYANQKGCQSLGYSLEELVSMQVEDIDANFIDNGKRFVDTFSPDNYIAIPQIDSQMQRKDGTRFPVEIQRMLLRLGDESVICGLVRDVSDKKKAQQQVSELSAQVAHLNRISSMGEMASAIAHELNQPLAAISNNAFMLSKLLDDYKPKEALEASDIAEEISQCALMAGEIVHRLRGFVSNPKVNREPSDVNEIVQESIKLLEVQFRHSEIKVRKDLRPGLPAAKVDRIQIQQVLVNLLINAMESIREANSEVRDVMVQTDLVGDELQIVINDSGPGIPKEVMDKLFDPFFTSKKDGMGMGLAISRSIIANHDGTIFVQSTASGTQFCIKIPHKPSLVEI